MSEANQKTVLTEQAYLDLCREALSPFGVADDLVSMVTQSLYWCDLHGISSHGLNMLPAYQHRLAHGGIHPNGRPKVTRQSGALASLDGAAGFGQVAGRVAAELAVELAHEHGVAVVSVHNTNHGGALGYFTDFIASQGLVGFMAHNSNLTVAPFGGAEPAIGTNPLSFVLTIIMVTMVFEMGLFSQAPMRYVLWCVPLFMATALLNATAPRPLPAPEVTRVRRPRPAASQMDPMQTT